MSHSSPARPFPVCLFVYSMDWLSIQVRVWAHRPPPILSIPVELDVGACLVGDAKSVTFTCRNTGGAGRFRLLTPEDYPQPSAAQRHNVALRMYPFNVSPTEFSLEPGEAVDICIDYVPLELGKHSVSFVMLCDNCQVARGRGGRAAGRAAREGGQLTSGSSSSSSTSTTSSF